jgi:hypothetical protein
MSLPTPPPRPPLPGGASDPGARRQLLVGVAQALRVLAERLAPQMDAAQDVTDFVIRAEEMAQEAWRLGAARVPDPAQAAALAAAFQAFIAEAGALSRKAAQEAAASRDLSGRMADQAGMLAKMAASPEAQDLATLRAQLRPVMVTLEELPGRMAAGHGMAADVAALGTRAAELGAQAMAVQQHRVSTTEKLLAICRSLRTLAEEAGVIAETLRGDNDRLRRTIGGVVSQVGKMGQAAGPAGPDSAGPGAGGAEARLTQVVAHGVAAGRPAAPAAPGQSLDWGIGRTRN